VRAFTIYIYVWGYKRKRVCQRGDNVANVDDDGDEGSDVVEGAEEAWEGGRMVTKRI
jgi:hypothetical protein